MQDTTPVEYRVVTDFPMYRVGSDGSAWSQWGKLSNGWQRMATPPDKDGYPKVLLYQGGKRRHTRVHVLVLECFVGPCPDGMEACHENGDHADPRLSNLRWDTHASNMADKARHGTAARGEGHGHAKLCARDIPVIVDMLRQGMPYHEIGAAFGVAASTIMCIAKNKTWTHIARETIVRKPYRMTPDDTRKGIAARIAANKARLGAGHERQRGDCCD